MPDTSGRRRHDQQNGQEQGENDAPSFDVAKNAHAIQSTGVEVLIVGQTCGENNWLHFGRFLKLTLRGTVDTLGGGGFGHECGTGLGTVFCFGKTR